MFQIAHTNSMKLMIPLLSIMRCTTKVNDLGRIYSTTQGLTFIEQTEHASLERCRFHLEVGKEFQRLDCP
jgi:hypothetical protein